MQHSTYLSYLLPAHSFMEISMYLLFPSLILARTGIQTRIEECEVAGRAPAHSPCSDFQWPCLVAGSSWLAPSLPHPIPIPTSQRSAADLGVMLGMMLKLSWCCQPRRSASLFKLTAQTNLYAFHHIQFSYLWKITCPFATGCLWDGGCCRVLDFEGCKCCLLHIGTGSGICSLLHLLAFKENFCCFLWALCRKWTTTVR